MPSRSITVAMSSPVQFNNGVSLAFEHAGLSASLLRSQNSRGLEYNDGIDFLIELIRQPARRESLLSSSASEFPA